jgi:phage tail sheath gpL-like
MISFNQISAFLRTPGFYVEFDNSMANKGLVLDMTRGLLLAQKLPTGTAPALTPIRTLSADQGSRDGGRGSMGDAMVRAFKAANDQGDLWVMYLDDNVAGTAAAGSVTVTGPATAAGTLNLYIGGVRVQVAVASGATANTVAADLAAAIAAHADLVVTAAVAGGTPTKVDITARHKGEAFNGLDIRTNYHQGEAAPAGLTLACVSLAAGTGNPDLTAALAALGDVQYHHLVLPYTDAANLAAVVGEFADRWSATRQIEGQVWTAHSGNHAALTTLGNGQNSEVGSVMGSTGSPTPAYLVAAIYGAVASFHLDIDPARPVQTLWLKGMLAPSEADRFTRSERNLLLFDGISTFTVTPDGRCLIERGVTTYQVNGYGLPDPSYLDVETPATLAVLRRTLRARLSQKFPRHKLADDGTNFGAGQAIVTPSIIRAELIALARQWEEMGWVERLDDFKAQLIVERNANDPTRVDAVLPPDLVNQLRVFAGLVQFRV